MSSRGQSHICCPLSSSMADWNPFDDNFNAESDDFLFGAEFDQMMRGSNTSWYCCKRCSVIKICQLFACSCFSNFIYSFFTPLM